MTRPNRFLVRMLLFLAVVVLLAAAVFEPLRAAFMANAPLNGLILGVFVLGALHNIRQVLTINPEIAWIEDFRRDQPSLSQDSAPRLLAPMATMLGEKKGDRLTLSALSMRSLLDGIAARLDEQRDISRYTTGLLIFLGLLGTFWGLLDTVGAIRDVIAALEVGSADMAAVFDELKAGLEKPLRGMGTAFSSSLFGLAGSLVLGFLDLQTGQAQNNFYTELEDWLSSLTRLSSGALAGGEGDQSVPAYVQALLEQTAESLENLQRTIARGEEGRIAANSSIIELNDKLGTIGEVMHAEQLLLKKLAEHQMEMKPLLANLAQASGGALDDASKGHLRSLDNHLALLVKEQQSGRDEMIGQLRSEIKLLARTIAGTKEA